MRLYRIKTHFYAKDLDEGAILGYILAENGLKVYDYINEKYMYGDWSEIVMRDREEIIAEEGDFDSENTGEFYDQKYGWEDLGEVSSDDIATLKRLKILPE